MSGSSLPQTMADGAIGSTQRCHRQHLVFCCHCWQVQAAGRGSFAGKVMARGRYSCAGEKHSDLGRVAPPGGVDSALLEVAAVVRSAVGSAVHAAARGAGCHLAHVAPVVREAHVSLEGPAHDSRKATSW